jgi:hypothetical protein
MPRLTGTMVLVFFIPLESQNIDTMTFPADESETSFEGKSINLDLIYDINLLKKSFASNRFFLHPENTVTGETLQYKIFFFALLDEFLY